jgi:hypothetical protein
MGYKVGDVSLLSTRLVKLYMGIIGIRIQLMVHQLITMK